MKKGSSIKFLDLDKVDQTIKEILGDLSFDAELDKSFNTKLEKIKSSQTVIAQIRAEENMTRKSIFSPIVRQEA